MGRAMVEKRWENKAQLYFLWGLVEASKDVGVVTKVRTLKREEPSMI